MLAALVSQIGVDPKRPSSKNIAHKNGGPVAQLTSLDPALAAILLTRNLRTKCTPIDGSEYRMGNVSKLRWSAGQGFQADNKRLAGALEAHEPLRARFELPEKPIAARSG
jgi:hypothetical protein